jgi:hypothetical protein
MKYNVIRYSIYGVIALLIGMGALAASRANAQRDKFVNQIDVLSYSWSVSPGQQARISVVNFDNEPIVGNIELLDREGRAFAQSGEIQVAPNHTNVFNYDGFIGGVTVARARINVRFITDKRFDIDRDRAPFAATVEIVDSATGKAALITTEWVFVAT